MKEATNQEKLAPALVTEPGIPPAPAEPALLERRGLRQVFRALRHRNFRLFCFGQIISLCGTWMQSVAQTWLIYRLTRSEFLMGLTYFCLQMPVFVLGPLGGLASDRRSRHRIIVITQALSMVQALMLAALTISGRVEVWHVLSLATVLGIINAFDMPARQSFIIEMASKEDLLNAISLNSSIFNVARVVGPGIAGLLVHRLGEGICFLLNGLSFAPVILSLLGMRLLPFQRSVAESPWEHLIQGFRFAYHTLHIRYLLLLLGAATISGVPALILMPFFAEDILGKGSRGLGILLASMGIGALVGTLGLAGRRNTKGLVKVILLGSTGLGVGLILLAISRNFTLSVAIMLLVGFSTLRQMASTNTLIQTVIPDEYRGRIMAMYTMTVVGLGPFASLLAGIVASRYGPPLTVAAGGVFCLLATLLFWARREEFRRSIRVETKA
ncbi:MAG: MFS transporter [Acidobacteria bacterium]|nr:MFS transporter [Acidobacteriota bacterium]